LKKDKGEGRQNDTPGKLHAAKKQIAGAEKRGHLHDSGQKRCTDEERTLWVLLRNRDHKHTYDEVAQGHGEGGRGRDHAWWHAASGGVVRARGYEETEKKPSRERHGATKGSTLRQWGFFWWKRDTPRTKTSNRST